VQLPPLVHNRLSYAGATIALLALTAIGFLLVVNTVAGGGQAPYAGLVIFALLPAVLLFGLFLIPVGMLLERRRVRLTGVHSMPRFPVIDLNDARQRNAALIFVVGSVLLLFLSVFGSFQAYEATESVAFCGSTCHTVMEPEKVAHQNSPHARVRCVECHVGPGAEYFVKSKLAGTRQLVGVLTDSYPRPIPVPIHDMRPARETCEHCHWPGQHADVERLKTRVTFLPDEQNTRWEIRLLVNVGSAHGSGDSPGIHWHLNPANRVEYIAADAARQEIPWVRVTDTSTGKVTVYESAESPLSAEQVAAGSVRTMDCLDCHNRPSHRFAPPDVAVDQALLAGEISATLPAIARVGTALLAAEYASVKEAEAAIDSGLRDYYGEHHPEVLAARGDELAAATRALQHAYRNNNFPAMKSNWAAYPDNGSHFRFPGCFRCHDGLHESADGESVTAECTTCHTITAQGVAGALSRSDDPQGLEFQHPPIADLEDAWQDTPCTDCHAPES